MTNARTFWLATVGRHEARLLLGEVLPREHVRIVTIATLDEQWSALQHGRPSRRVGKDNHSYASEGHETEERLRRFASDVVQWIEHQTTVREIRALTVFVAPRMLGELRKAFGGVVDRRLELRDLDLGHMTLAELARHDAVLAIRPQESGRAT